MKYVYILIVLIAVIILLVTSIDTFDRNQLSQPSNEKFEVQTTQKESHLINSKKNPNGALNRDGFSTTDVELITRLNDAVDSNDLDKFRVALRNVFSSHYLGDPVILFKELTPYLQHENKGIRFHLSKGFIWAGFEREKAIQTLIKFIDDENEMPVVVEAAEDFNRRYTIDYRKMAADLLTKYNVLEAADPIWKLYKQTKNTEYLENLRVFKDERSVEAVHELVNSKKAKYSDFVSIVGTFKVEAAAESLERIYQARLKQNPEANSTSYAWSLYQITGEQEYYNYLVKRDYYRNNVLFDVPEVLQILENELRADDGSDINAKGRFAFESLLAREEGHAILENYLIDLFDEKIDSKIDVSLRYRTAAHLNTPALNAAVQRYENKYGNGFWNHFRYHKEWPVNDLTYKYTD